MTGKWTTITVGGAAFMLVACATPSDRIATELTRFGLNQSQAICVGERLEARLSIGQLRQLGRAAKAYSSNDPNPGQLTVADLARVSVQINDPKVPVEVATAGASCGVLRRFLSR